MKNYIDSHKQLLTISIEITRKFLRILAFVLVLTSILSCKKDEGKTQGILEKETISAKWVVDGTSDFESFEFNKSGNYIVVKTTATKSTNGQIVLFGTYEILDAETIVLSDLGTMKILNIGETSLSFRITIKSDPTTEISISAIKQPKTENSAKTDLLCRTWELVSLNGINAIGTNIEQSVLFSDAGTYFVKPVNPEIVGGLAQWTWKDANETKLCYSWEGVPTCDGTNEVEITELTNSVLKFTHLYYGMELAYVLKPTSNIKSASYESNEIKIKSGLKSGFLNK